MTSGALQETAAADAEGGLAKKAPTGVILIRSPANARASVSRTEASVSLGSTRQLTMARAIWGSALAWPPSSRVATHVVRMRAL
jgi:hypothetical protein